MHPAGSRVSAAIAAGPLAIVPPAEVPIVSCAIRSTAALARITRPLRPNSAMPSRTESSTTLLTCTSQRTSATDPTSASATAACPASRRTTP
jgi:hypothetical protein